MRAYVCTSRAVVLTTALMLISTLGGCAWLDALQEVEEEPKFPQWSQNLGGGMGAQPKKEESGETKAPKSKSLFFNERSREVEKSIGYE